jgi:hypothetical protein
VRAGAADLARIRSYRSKFETQAGKDARVRVVHRLVALLQALEIRVKRVRVLHRELACAHHAEARANLVAELRLDLVEVHRQLAVAADFRAHHVAHHFLGGRRVAELALGTILDAQHERAVQVPASGFLPELRGLYRRCQHLERAGAVHLLAHYGLDFAHHAQAERHPGVQPGAEPTDKSGAQHQPMAHEFGLGGCLF